MRALFYTLIGFLFIGSGAYNLYGGYELERPLIAAYGFGAIIIGTILSMYGFSQRGKRKETTEKTETMTSNNSYKDENAPKEEDGALEIYAIIQAMGVVAVADKRVRQEEVDTISGIYKEMLGMKIRDEEVREILSEFDDHFDIEERLTRNRAYISPAMKRTIIQSCQKVMVSDLEIVRSEENRIMEIGRALGFQDPEIETLIATTPK